MALLILAVMASGCAGTKKHPVATPSAPVPKVVKAVKPTVKAAKAGKVKTIVTPDLSLMAKVVIVNSQFRHVVLNFPGGQLPKPQQPLFLYRDGLKVAELKATESKDANNNNLVADIVAGAAQVGDTVRDQ